ncbi:sphingomyelin phosphodiesterase acid-like 3 [Pelomyxa schiedti]|nr:sphingomyelin phosphodiesterase acid-like 3 [Pelomyxa schiedti]
MGFRGGFSRCTVVALVSLLAYANALVGSFWVITDIHLADDYVSGTDPTSFCTNGTGAAGKYGYFNCDSPEYTLLPSALSFMKQVPSDFLLWLGDSPTTYHEHPAGVENSDMIWNNIREVVSDLSTGLPDMDVYPTLGNHDAYPKDRVKPPPNDEYYSQFVSLWKHWLPAAAIDTVGYSGYYTAVLTPGFRVISLNTLYCDPANVYAMLNQSDHGGQWQWVGDTLKSARANNEKVLLIGHIPLGILDIEPVPMWADVCMEHYNNLTQEYHDIIAGQFFGHLHYDTWRIIREESGKPINTAYLVPGFTPRAASSSVLAPNTPGKNPAIRLYHYDTTTFELLDYDQYYTDLLAGNAAGELTWEIEYSAVKYYGLRDLSPASMDELSARLLTEDATWEQFFNVWFVGRIFEGCNTNCRLREACATAHVELRQFLDCTGALS